MQLSALGRRALWRDDSSVIGHVAQTSWHPRAPALDFSPSPSTDPRFAAHQSAQQACARGSAPPVRPIRPGPDFEAHPSLACQPAATSCRVRCMVSSPTSRVPRFVCKAWSTLSSLARMKVEVFGGRCLARSLGGSCPNARRARSR
jgi:hypothetical protein